MTTVTGTVTGRTMQPLAAEQLPWSSPLTAVALVVAVRDVIPITPDTKVPNGREAVTWTPATGPTTPAGQSGLVLLLVGSTPAPTTAASEGLEALVPSARRSVPQMSV